MASFESERKVIQLQAEKNAQEQIQAQQQQVFQKQLELMDKWQNGAGGGSGSVFVPPLPLTEEPPPTTAQDRPRPEVETQQRNTAPAVERTVETTNPSVKSAAPSNGRNNDQSADTSLVDSGGISYEDDYSSEDYSDASHPVAPPNTPAERQDTTSINSGSTGTKSQKSAASSSRGTNYASNVGAAQQASDRIEPHYPDPNEQQPDTSDEITLGQTVASSTYGEDRIKVVEKDLLDPYGDKGTYTGVVLRTTGMPHGLGRMIYEEDGRIYEGDW